MDTAYVCPKFGFPPRTLYGKGPKEQRDGYHSMYKLLAKQSGGNDMGPGKYAVDALEKGYGQTQERQPKWSFKRTQTERRGTKPPPVPGPGAYDRNAFNATLPRLQFGKLLKGEKCKSMSFSGSGLPPGKYDHKQMLATLTTHNSMPSFQRSMKKNESRPLPKKDAPGPGAYNSDWKHIEERTPKWGFPKTKMKRFTEACQDADRWKAPPGAYPDDRDKTGAKGLGAKGGATLPINVESRGTKWSQLHGVGRSSMHGTF